MWTGTAESPACSEKEKNPMDMTQESCRGFVAAVASRAPAPGGGGGAALVGAIGTALGHMAGALTVGKPRYAQVQESVTAVMEQCDELQALLLDQVEADGRGFAPLLRAYALDRADPGRQAAIEKASMDACAVPLRIMELCGQALECMAVFAAQCSRHTISDVGCGVVLCKSALQAASLNVFINTASIKNRAAAGELNQRANRLLETYCPLADRLYADVVKQLTAG